MPGVPSDIHRCVDRMHGKPATPVPNGPKIGVTVGRYPRRMFERLKRVLSGSPPESPQPPAAQEEPGRLDWITEDTPYRFRTWLEDPARRDDAIEILDRQLGAELKTTAIDEPDGRIRLDIVSTFNGGAALLRPLYQLRHHGVLVRDLEVLDSVDDISSHELHRLVDAWQVRAGHRAVGRRIEALAGEGTLRLALESNPGGDRLNGWDMIVSWIGRHTPGTEALILGKAVAEKDVSRAARLTGAVVGRGELAELVNDSFDPPVDLVLQLAQRRARVAEQAFRIAETLPAPLSDELTTALCVAARRGSISDTAAVRALRKARPTAEVREALAAALESSDADVRGLALDSLGELFGIGARPYWQAWLASSSAPQRMAAEDVIGAYGDADDVPLAAEHLGKIIRRKSSISWQPPRGNEIITLLVRHRDLPEAQAALADLTKRWPKLPEELQTWLREHHPDLVPAEAASLVVAGEPNHEVDAEPPLTWPVPEIKRDGKEFYLGFWDTDMFDIRDRFEDLLEAHPAVTIVDGDREWTTARIDVPDPDALVAELWARAQESNTP